MAASFPVRPGGGMPPPGTPTLVDLEGEARIAAAFEAGDRRGCLSCSAAAGVAGRDPEVAGRIDGQLDRLTAAFAAALRDTRAFGRADEDARAREAERLTLQSVGLRVRGRAGLAPPPEGLPG